MPASPAVTWRTVRPAIRSIVSRRAVFRDEFAARPAEKMATPRNTATKVRA